MNLRYLFFEIAIRVVLIGVMFKFFFGQPFERRVYGADWNRHQYPWTHNEQWDFWTLCIVMVSTIIILPVLFLVTFQVWKRMPRTLASEDGLNLALGITLNISLTWLTTEMMKILYGGLRPDFLSRCFGEENRAIWPKIEDIPAIPDCTMGKLKGFPLVDGRKSFPSGHASLAACVYLYLALYLYRKFSQIKNSGSFRIVVPSACMLFAIAVILSRTSDYRHFPADVIVGALIGTIYAILTWWFYDQLLNSIYSKYCERHGLAEADGYLHDPLSLATPAQFAPYCKTASIPAQPQVPSARV